MTWIVRWIAHWAGMAAAVALFAVLTGGHIGYAYLGAAIGAPAGLLGGLAVETARGRRLRTAACRSLAMGAPFGAYLGSIFLSKGIVDVLWVGLALGFALLFSALYQLLIPQRHGPAGVTE